MTDSLAQTKDPVVIIALGELTRRGLDPRHYAARVTDSGDILIVVFRDRDLPPAHGVLSQNIQPLRWKISAKDKKVIKSYFAR